MYRFADNCQFNAVELNQIYEEAFGVDKVNGWFVEIGASDGSDYSNTSGLADMGWNGIYVEPVKQLAEKCRRRHRMNRVTVLTAAAGKENHMAPIYMIPAWGTATLNESAADIICKGVDGPDAIAVNVLKLDTIVCVGGCSRYFDLLVIDVDFGEIQVLQGFNLNHWMPRLVIIELHEESKHPLSEQVRQFAIPFFEEAGYKKIYKDGINTIFKREKLAYEGGV